MGSLLRFSPLQEIPASDVDTIEAPKFSCRERYRQLTARHTCDPWIAPRMFLEAVEKLRLSMNRRDSRLWFPQGCVERMEKSVRRNFVSSPLQSEIQPGGLRDPLINFMRFTSVKMIQSVDLKSRNCPEVAAGRRISKSCLFRKCNRIPCTP